MVKKIMIISVSATLSCSAADSLLKPVNDAGFGTVSTRVQALSMYRDFEGVNPGNAYSTTLGLRLGYTTTELLGLTYGMVWDYVEPVDSSKDSDNGITLLSNGRVNEMTEAWLKYNFGLINLSNTVVKAGRQVVNDEVFRADEVRHKPRSLEAVTLTTKDIPGTTVTVGHAWRLSNWQDNKTGWKFNNINAPGITNTADRATRGISWVETVNTSVTNLEVAVYDAYAHDIANIVGGRVKYSILDGTAVQAYCRNENETGNGAKHNTDMFGVSLLQKVGGVMLEPGFFSVHGDTLVFEETTTGINHPLGSSMMIYSQMFNGGADTCFMKATAKIGKTSLYALYNYTTQSKENKDKLIYDGQELNVVIKQSITDRFSVAVKVGAGYRDVTNGKDDTTASDARLFVTWDL